MNYTIKSIFESNGIGNRYNINSIEYDPKIKRLDDGNAFHSRSKGFQPNEVPGVYFLSLFGVYVYVGISVNIQQRIWSHQGNKIFDLAEFIVEKNLETRQIIERFFIKEFHPIFNKLGKNQYASYDEISHMPNGYINEKALVDTHIAKMKPGNIKISESRKLLRYYRKIIDEKELV